ncbi:MAG: hypothetical protein QXX17_02145 [Conexivisphaerales archaeon]
MAEPDKDSEKDWSERNLSLSSCKQSYSEHLTFSSRHSREQNSEERRNKKPEDRRERSRLLVIARILSMLVFGALIIDISSAARLVLGTLFLTCGCFDVFMNILRRESTQAEEEELMRYV